MITSQEIKARARKKYLAFVRARVADEPFFPLEIPFGKPRANADYGVLRAWVDELVNHSKTELGYGYTVTLQERETRRYGRQSLPQRICIGSADDFLRFIGKPSEFKQVDAMVMLTRIELPQLIDWIAQHVRPFLNHLDVWPQLLHVCRYFIDHPRPNVYARELPINVHTKFVEEHRGILRQLLDTVLPTDAIRPDETNFESRFYLRNEEPLIRLRLLAPDLQATLKWPVSDLSAPVSQIATLTLAGRQVLIVENKKTFLTLPPLPDTIAIFGQGFQVGALREVDWLHQCPIYYWGDLDVQGFAILAQVRTHFPQTRALLMDTATLEQFQHFAVSGTPSKTASVPTLTPTEEALYQHLHTNNLRLEQERISHSHVLHCLAELFA